MMPKKYLLLEDRVTLAGLAAKAGTVVYDYLGCDYGLASLDSRVTGAQHRSVTLSPDGSSPSFTVPEHTLRLLPG